MSIDQIVSEHNKLDFQDQSELAYQQTESVLWDCVDEQSCEGEASVGVKIFGQVEAQERRGRLPKNLDNRVPRTKRWLKYRDPVESGEYIEDTDMWKQAFDATSDLQMAHAAAIHRKKDDRVIEGMFGDAYEGKAGLEKTIKFPAANIIPVDTHDENSGGSGPIGLNLKKMRVANLKLKQSFVYQMYPSERPKFGMTAKQNDDLLQYLQVTSVDFRPGEDPAIQSGRVIRIMGFDIVECERWPLKSGTTDVRLNAAWIKKALKKGVWSPFRARMWNDGSVNNAPIFNNDIVFDCRRMQDAGVLQVECQE